VIGPLLDGLAYIMRRRRIPAWFNTVVSNLRWNFLIRFIITNYFQLTLASFLQLTNFDTTNALAVTGQVMTIISIIILIMFPVWCIFIVKLRGIKYSNEVFSEKFGTLIDGYEVQTYSKVNSNYTCILCVRKICFMISIVLLNDYPNVGLVFLMIQSFVLIVLIQWSKPFDRKELNLKNTLEEVAFIVIDFMLLLIYNGAISEDSFKAMGWVMVTLCCLVIVYNLYFVIKSQIESSIAVFKKISALYKAWKRRKIRKRRIKRPRNWIDPVFLGRNRMNESYLKS